MRVKLRIRALAWVLAVLMVVGVVNVPPKAGKVQAEGDNECKITFISEIGYLDENSPTATMCERNVTKGSGIYSQPFFYGNSTNKRAFIGWKLNGEGELLDSQDLTNIVVESDMTFYAQTVSAYIVKFYSEGGYYDPGDSSEFEQMVPEGNTLDWFSEPSKREGYKFVGWKINNEGDIYSTSELSYYKPTSDVTLYAQWEELGNTFTVKYVSDVGYINGDETQKEYTVKIEEGEQIQYHTPSMYGYSGYSFDYWINVATGEKVDELYSFTPTQDITFKAVWRAAPTYKIKYISEAGYIEGDSSNKEYTYEVECGNRIFYSYPSVYGRPNYGKKGWRIDGTDKVLSDDDLNSYVPTQDTTIYVVWDEAYTVTFNSEEGYINGIKNNKTYNISVAKGNKIGQSLSMYGTNEFTFIGWKLEGSDDLYYSEDISEYVPNGNVTFVAQWERSYKITFKSEPGYLHGSKFATEVTEYIWYGYSINGNVPDVYGWSGHAINGWRIEGEDKIYTQEEVYNYYPDGDVTFIANWVESYEITFKSVSGYIEGDNPYRKEYITEVAKGASLSGKVPEMGNMHGYVFSGWKEENGSDVIDNIENYVPTKDTVLVAVWEEAYIIKFVSDEGYIQGDPDSKLYERQVKKGDTISLSGPGGVYINGRPGYIFDYWSVNGKKIENTYNYCPNGNETIKANWAEAYDVTFESDEGYFYGYAVNKRMVYQIRKGSPISNCDTPYNRPYYAFSYWSYNGVKIEDIYSFIPKGNVTIKANWTKAVKVTIDYDGGFFEYSSGNRDYPRNKVSYVAENTKTNIYVQSTKKDGQILIGWKIKGDSENNLYRSDDIEDYVVGTEDVTFVAQYGKAINVFFDPNGGYFNDAPGHQNYGKKKVEVAEQNLFGMYISAPSIDVESGKLFLGWKLEGDTSETIYSANDLYQSFRVGTEDITFVAQWEQGINITFELNGGYYLSGPGQSRLTQFTSTIPKGGKLNYFYISPRHDSPRNYFAGWSVDDGLGNVTTYTNESITQVIFNEATTVKAIWKNDGYIVKYVSSEGYLKYNDTTATTFEVSVAPGEVYGSIPGYPIYTGDSNGRVGYYMGYWTKAGDSKHYSTDDISNLVINGDTTFTANWIKSIKVTYNANGGVMWSGPGTKVGSYDSYYKLNATVYFPTASYEGYSFVGWSERKADGTIGNKYTNNDSYKVTSDVTFTAIWKNNVTGEVINPSYLNPVPSPNPSENVKKNTSSSGSNNSNNKSNTTTPEKKTAPKYSEEWINGKWYDKDGNQTYEGTLSWKSDSTGWWVEDSAGWYPVSQWQKIDGIWYYFNASGYMASGEYYNGYWFNSDGSWDSQYYLSWKSDSTGWWVEDVSGWWPSSSWLKVDGYWYYFNSSGYMVTNQYVDGYWISSDGVCY